MTELWRLPQEITDQIVQILLDDIYCKDYNKYPQVELEVIKSLGLRRVCYAVNTAVEDYFLHLDLNVMKHCKKYFRLAVYFLPLYRIALLHSVRRDLANHCALVPMIRQAGEIMSSAIAANGDTANDQEDIWKVLCPTAVRLLDHWILPSIIRNPRKTLKVRVFPDLVLGAAAHRGDVRLLCRLLPQRSDLSTDDFWIEHPLMTASRRGHLSAVGIIMQRSPAGYKGPIFDSNQDTLLHCAVESGDIAVLTFWVDRLETFHFCDTNKQSRSAGQLAVIRRRQDMINIFCDRYVRAKREAASGGNNNPMRILATATRKMIWTAARDGLVTELKSILANTGLQSIDEPVFNGNAVYAASYWNRFEAVKILMKHKQDAAIENDTPNSAWLGLLASARRGNQEIFEYFLGYQCVLDDLQDNHQTETILCEMLKYRQVDLLKRAVCHDAFDSLDHRKKLKNSWRDTSDEDLRGIVLDSPEIIEYIQSVDDNEEEDDESMSTMSGSDSDDDTEEQDDDEPTVSGSKSN